MQDALSLAVWGAVQMRWTDSQDITISWIITHKESRKSVCRND